MIKKFSALSTCMMMSLLCAADQTPGESVSSRNTLVEKSCIDWNMSPAEALDLKKECFQFLKFICLPKHSRMREIFEKKYVFLQTIEQETEQDFIAKNPEFLKKFYEAYIKIHNLENLQRPEFSELKKNYSLLSDFFMNMDFAQEWIRRGFLKNNILCDQAFTIKISDALHNDMDSPDSQKTFLSELGLKIDDITLRSTSEEWESGSFKDHDNNTYQFVLIHEGKPLDISCFKIKKQYNLFASFLYTPKEQGAFVHTHNLEGKVILNELKRVQNVNLLIEHAYYNPTIASSVDCQYKTNVFLANYQTVLTGNDQYRQIPTAPRAILLYEWPKTLLTYSSTYEQVKDSAYICVSESFKSQSQLLQGRIKYFNEHVIPFQNFNVPESQGEYTSDAHKLFIEREVLQTYLNELFKTHNADLITVQNLDGSSMHYAQDPRQFLPLTCLTFHKVKEEKTEQVAESVFIKEETPVKQEIRVKEEPRMEAPERERS